MTDLLTKMADALESLLSYDKAETEYDGQMMYFCPACGEDDGKHRDSCDFVAARAVLADFKAHTAIKAPPVQEEYKILKKKHDGPCWRNSHADCGC